MARVLSPLSPRPVAPANPRTVHLEGGAGPRHLSQPDPPPLAGSGGGRGLAWTYSNGGGVPASFRKL